MRGTVGVVGSCWIQQSNTLIGLLALKRASQQSNKSEGGRVGSKAVGAARVVSRHLVNGECDLLGIDQAVDDLDQRAAVAAHDVRDLPDGQPGRVVGQCGKDNGVERRNALNRAVRLDATALLSARFFRSVQFLAEVARRAGSDQIGEIVCAAFADGENVVNVEHHIRRELSAVAAGELVSLKNGPTNGVPVVSDLSRVSHTDIVAQFAQFAHTYQIAKGVQ